MDDEGADIVFVPPPPAVGDASKRCVTRTNGADDATAAEDNPSSLQGHHSETQPTDAHIEEDDEDTVSLSSGEDTVPPTDVDQTTLENAGRFMDPGGDVREQLREDAEHAVIFSEREENSEADEDREQMLSNFEEESEKKDDQTGRELIKHRRTSEDTTEIGTVLGAVEVVTQMDSDTNQSPAEDITPQNWKATVCAQRDELQEQSEDPELGPPSDQRQETLEGERSGNETLRSDIQQGEERLRRLQLLHQDQEGHVSTSSTASQQDESLDVEEPAGREQDSAVESFNMDSKTNLMEMKEDTCEDIRGQPAFQSHDLEEHQEDRLVSGFSPVITHQTSSASRIHRFSAAETVIERQIHEAVGKNLQRASGVFNLTENPDVLEFPFSTDILLEPPPTQFSEQKMHKEISQETQRELVLVNQEKTLGLYCRGEVPQLEETKLLFEAFQQDHTEGPARNRRTNSSLTKCHVCPSVLERAQSFEMFSLKTHPVSRAHSFKLQKPAASEHEKSLDGLRSRSPTGTSWDKTRLSPYSKQDKHLKPYRSMDSIATDAHPSSVDTIAGTQEGRAGGRGSPLLKHNPFFKLRPALALQPDVEKDIRETREREEELRRQRWTLYGEKQQRMEEEEKTPATSSLQAGETGTWYEGAESTRTC